MCLINNNQIKFIDSKAFDGLKSLNSLNIQNNQINTTKINVGEKIDIIPNQIILEQSKRLKNKSDIDKMINLKEKIGFIF